MKDETACSCTTWQQQQQQTDMSVLLEGQVGQRKYLRRFLTNLGIQYATLYAPFVLFYPEKEPMVIKFYRLLDLNGYEEDRKNSLRQLVQPFPFFFFKFVII